MDNKTLVAYFSASGQTAKLAKTLADVMKADIFEIKPKQPYTAVDLDWNDRSSRSSIEMKDPACRPEIAGRVENMDQYGTVFVGFPIWWYEAPRIIASFLEAYDFSGKTVIPFATSGGSGMGKTDSILQSLCSSSTAWKTGVRLSSGASMRIVQDWVNSLGL